MERFLLSQNLRTGARFGKYTKVIVLGEYGDTRKLYDNITDRSKEYQRHTQESVRAIHQIEYVEVESNIEHKGSEEEAKLVLDTKFCVLVPLIKKWHAGELGFGNCVIFCTEKETADRVFDILTEAPDREGSLGHLMGEDNIHLI